MLERGPFLPREKENWDTKIAFNTTRYFGPEVWSDKDGGEVRAGLCYHGGGNTQLHGAALFRLRELEDNSGAALLPVELAAGRGELWPAESAGGLRRRGWA